METITTEKVLSVRTLYFFYNPETNKAVTKSLKYSELMALQKELENSDKMKLGELVYDVYKGKCVSIIPEEAIPMEVKYRKIEHWEENSNPEVKPKAVKVFTIREPIWKDPRSVGLSYNDLVNANEDIICVKIVYRMRSKNDELLYPDPFFMDREKALKYPIKTVSAGTKVTIIPIQDFRDRA